MIVTNALVVVLALIAFNKTRRNTSALQQVALWGFIGIALTYLGIVAWQNGRPILDADGTRDRIIEQLTVGDE